MAFTPEERELLASLPESAVEEWTIRASCAKGAVASALGNGLVEGPQSVRLRELEAETGVVKLSLGDEVARALPRLAGARIVAYTSREGEYIFAFTACEAGS